jgi:hypothetical protein
MKKFCDPDMFRPDKFHPKKTKSPEAVPTPMFIVHTVETEPVTDCAVNVEDFRICTDPAAKDAACA